MKYKKIIVAGLPRSGTTTICKAFLDLGYQVAHCAYTDDAITQAGVLADTPAFSDFERLGELCTPSGFVYLQRSFEAWKPSFQNLLQSMIARGFGLPVGSPFHPWVYRSYQQVFGEGFLNQYMDDDYLYLRFRQYEQRQKRHHNLHADSSVIIDLQARGAASELLRFVGRKSESLHFEHLNQCGKITDWDRIDAPGKISKRL